MRARLVLATAAFAMSAAAAAQEPVRLYAAGSLRGVMNDLAVGTDYGITLISGAPESAGRFAAFVLSPEGQRIIERHGFALP